MADISNALRDYLASLTSVTAYVGDGSAARIYHHRIKQGVKVPFIRLEMFSGRSEQHLDGVSGVAMVRIQVDCYGLTSSQAYQLAEAVRLAPLQAFRGLMSGVHVLGVMSDGGYDRGYDPPPKGSTQGRYFVSRDYEIWYRESTS